MELGNITFDGMSHGFGNTVLWFCVPLELFPNQPELTRRVILQVTYPRGSLSHARYRKSETELIALNSEDAFLEAIDFPITEEFFNQLIELAVREAL